MWPYWMDASSQGPVPNDIVAMDGLYLLTGASHRGSDHLYFITTLTLADDSATLTILVARTPH